MDYQAKIEKAHNIAKKLNLFHVAEVLEDGQLLGKKQDEWETMTAGDIVKDIIDELED